MFNALDFTFDSVIRIFLARQFFQLGQWCDNLIIAFQFANEDFFGRLHLGWLGNFLGADWSHFIFREYLRL
jgi:hypothetical protein